MALTEQIELMVVMVLAVSEKMKAVELNEQAKIMKAKALTTQLS